MWACITYHDVSHSNIECVDMMIAEGCQINAKDKLGRYISTLDDRG